MMNFEQARFNMIEQQIRPWEVLDTRVLEVLNEIHREDFVPLAYRAMAFADMNIPIGHDQVMMQPRVEARLLQELGPTGHDNVLEIGTGTGHMTALLASLAGHVDTVDIFADFSEAAHKRLSDHGLDNIHYAVGDAARGWEGEGPYDSIILTGSVPTLPESYKHNLAPNGRLVVIVGKPPIMEALLIQRIGENAWTETSLFDTSLPPLVNTETPPEFVF